MVHTEWIQQPSVGLVIQKRNRKIMITNVWLLRTGNGRGGGAGRETSPIKGKIFWGPSWIPLTLLKQFLGWNKSPLLHHAGSCTYGITIRGRHGLVKAIPQYFSVLAYFSLQSSLFVWTQEGPAKFCRQSTACTKHTEELVSKVLHQALCSTLINFSWK